MCGGRTWRRSSAGRTLAGHKDDVLSISGLPPPPLFALDSTAQAALLSTAVGAAASSSEEAPPPEAGFLASSLRARRRVCLMACRIANIPNGFCGPRQATIVTCQQNADVLKRIQNVPASCAG